MIKHILILITFTLAVGCASQEKTAHHHHKPEYGGKCAYSVAHGKHDVVGKEEFQVKYKNKIYYFSNSEMKDHFLGEIKTNIQKANTKWDRLGDRIKN